MQMSVMREDIKPNILIIDDSTLDLRLLIEMMTVRKMRLNVAFDGKDGYNKAVMQQPDLILLDVVMPVMDGFATCRMLKNNQRTRNIPIVFLSAASEVENRLEGFSLGAVDYIGKPYNEQEVIARVEVHLNLVRQCKGGGDAKPDCDPVADLACRDSVLLRTATQYLRENLSQPPSPDVLAKLLGTNEKRLNQVFQNAFSLPVFAWLREEKLRMARELLVTTDIAIADISEHFGYSSPANFAKAFRERFDCSARELRLEVKKHNMS
jgi:DNA-binding response OmpR family regulator